VGLGVIPVQKIFQDLEERCPGVYLRREGLAVPTHPSASRLCLFQDGIENAEAVRILEATHERYTTPTWTNLQAVGTACKFVEAGVARCRRQRCALP